MEIQFLSASCRRSGFCQCIVTMLKTLCVLLLVACNLTTTTAYSIGGKSKNPLLQRVKAASVTTTVRSASKCGSVISQKVCKKACYKAQAFCERSCQRPSGPCGEQAKQANVDKMQCIAGCFRPTAQDYFQLESNGWESSAERRTIAESQPDRESAASAENGRQPSINVRKLLSDRATMRKLCATDAFKDARACRAFTTEEKRDDESPLSNTATEVGVQGTARGRENQTPTAQDTPTQSGRHTFTRVAENKLRRPVRRRRSASQITQEYRTDLCQSKRKHGSQAVAKHRATKRMVHLSPFAFFGRCGGNHTLMKQEFQTVEGCESPLTDVIQGNTGYRCEKSFSEQLADFLIEVSSNGTASSPFRDIISRKKCETYSDLYLICRDWVLIPTHCTLRVPVAR